MIYDITPYVETGNADYDGYPAAYEHEYFELSGRVLLNITSSNLYDVKVQIHLPTDVYSITDCDEMVDGTLTQCSTANNNYSPIYINTTTAKLTFGAGLNSSQEPVVTLIDGYILEFAVSDVYSTFYNTSNFNSSVVTEEESITVFAHVYIKTQVALDLCQFNIKVMVDDTAETSQEQIMVRSDLERKNFVKVQIC